MALAVWQLQGVASLAEAHCRTIHSWTSITLPRFFLTLRSRRKRNWLSLWTLAACMDQFSAVVALCRVLTRHFTWEVKLVPEACIQMRLLTTRRSLRTQGKPFRLFEILKCDENGNVSIKQQKKNQHRFLLQWEHIIFTGTWMHLPQ